MPFRDVKFILVFYMPGRQSLRKINKCMHHIPSISTIINSAKENFCTIMSMKSMRIMFYCSTACVANYGRVLLTHLEHWRTELGTEVALLRLISWMLQNAWRGCLGQLLICLKVFQTTACSSVLLLTVQATITEKENFHCRGLFSISYKIQFCYNSTM